MSCGRGGGQVLRRSAPIWLLAFNSRVLLFPGPTRDACEVAVPRGWVAPGTHLSSPCCACRQLPTFREFFGSVGPRLQDWVQALRATAGGSAQAPTPDGEQLPEETWLFLQVLGEKWAEGNTAPMTVPAGSIPLSYPWVPHCLHCPPPLPCSRVRSWWRSCWDRAEPSSPSSGQSWTLTPP